MLESAPFVERYAIYSYFPSNWAMIVNGVLTPAGTNYLKQQSSLAYIQELPAGGSRSLAQFEFEGNTLDSSGYGNNGFAVGNPGYAAGHTGQAVTLDGANSYLQLPPNVANSAGFTFAAWVYWSGGANWQRIFDFGDDTSHYLFLTPSSGSGTLHFAINNGGGEQLIETTGMPAGQWQHVAVTLSGSSAKLYTNGVLAASSSSFSITPSNFNPNRNYLGKSQFPADPLFRGSLDEVQIADYALSAAQIAALLSDTPPQFTTNILSGGTAPIATLYSGSIAGTATDADPGDTLTYSKAGGPAWLTVAADGTLSGTPTATDGGTNNFTVCVTDAAGARAFARLTIITPFTQGNGMWYVDGSGLWSDTSKWTRACVANGAGLTADFSTLDITADRTVTLDSSRSIGAMAFADYAGAQGWTLAASGGSVLRLDSGSTASPSILVGDSPTLATSNAVTISAPLAGTNGLSKTGWGTLILSGNNPLSGTLNVDIGSTTANEGAVRLAAPGAATNLAAINIHDNNDGSSTLQLAGGVVSPAAVALSGRNTYVVAIENLSGSNLLSGGLTINVGGGFYVLQSDAGTLNLGGVVSSAAGSTRTVTFRGDGDHYISGSIQNGNAAALSLSKLDAGNLVLANANTFSGAVSVGGGIVKVSHPLALQSNALTLACASASALKFGPVTAANFGSLSSISDVWLTNSSSGAVTLTSGLNNAGSEFAGAFKGAGGLVKAGAGALTLDNTNMYSGATTVAGGTLRFGIASNLTAALQPVLWLNFDATGNGVVTNLGTGGWAMNGTLVGNGAYLTNAGRFGKALYIDGNGGAAATNILQIPSKLVDTSASGSWTVSCWLKTTTAGAVFLYQGDGTWSSSGQTAYLLNANSGSVAGTHAGAVRWAGGFLTGTATLNDGNWHHIALVDSAGAESIYVDGNVDTLSSTMRLALASGANQTWIGGAPDTDAGAVKLSGLVDEVCMFSRALSAGEIRALYTNALTVGKLPVGSAVSVAAGATLDLAGISQAVASLADYNGSGGLVTNTSSAPVTLTLSINNTATLNFSGTISDASAANAISVVKSGASTQVLSGNNPYSGPTTVSNGTLVVNGAIGTNAVYLRLGTLAGNGAISGPVTIYAGGTLSPGSNAVGALTINASLTLGGTAYFELDKNAATNDTVLGLTTVNYGGTLTVASLSGVLAAGDRFKLFSAVNYTGTFAATNLPVLAPGLGWNFDPASGRLSVVQVVATNPPTLLWTANGTNLTLSWPVDHVGWRLLVQTNDLASGLSLNSNDWMTVPGSQTTNQVSLTLDPTHPAEFYRLVYPHP